MTRPHTAMLSLAVLMSACVRSPGTEPPAPPVRPYLGGLLPIGRWGVGPIRAGAYFEDARIRELFPKAKVTATEVQIDPDDPKDTRPAILVSQDGQPLLEIDDSNNYAPGTDDPIIGPVRAVGGPVRGPHGERLGIPWTAAGFDVSQCDIGDDQDKNRMVCARPGDGAVTYIFAIPGWNSEEAPPRDRLRAVASLAEIVWTPPKAPRH